jgi:DNA-binding beta-propeller fold protein YncE
MKQRGIMSAAVSNGLLVFGLVFLAVIAGLRVSQLAAAASTFTRVEGWPQVPSSVPMGFISWVDVDPSGLVYVFRRCPIKCSDNPHPGANDPPGSVLLFDSSGKYLREWEPKSGGKWKEAHGLYVDKDGFIWTADVQLNVVRKYRADGALLMTLGKVGIAGETSDTFNKPTNAFVAADGSIFVTDGYGNQRVVKFSKDGKFIKAWGKMGTGPGEFRIPHAVTQDKSGRIIVADRCGLGATKCTDGRVQVFDTDGNFITQWTPPGGKFAPFAVAVDTSDRLYIDDTENSRVWILDAKSLKLLDSIDGAAGHGMGVSRNGSDIYLTGSKAGVERYTRGS